MSHDRAPDDLLQLERFLPYRLSVLANTVSATIASAYASQHDLTIPEWRVMAVLAHEPGLSAAEVAERTAMDKVAVSRAVSRLMQRGRVARRQAEDDRRRSSLLLTPTGLDVYRQVSPVALAYEGRLLGSLTDEERRSLDSAMERLLHRARELAAESIIGSSPTSPRPRTGPQPAGQAGSRER
jgi:DNA-binding MarR family transcriptional regulator